MICSNCNTQNPDHGAFCVGCGQPLSAPQASPLPPQPEQQYAPPPTQPFPQYTASAAPVDDEAKDAENNKIMGILSYLSLLVLVPIFAAKESKFARFHANQGIVLCAAEVAIQILRSIFSAIFPYRWTNALSYTRGPVYGIISAVLWVAMIGVGVLAIIGLINAIKGEKKELPLIGKIKILK